MAFVHLHTHSEYSLLDGANRIPDLLDRVQALGMDSLAITDHGNLHGAWQFYTEAKARNVRPILGFEAYLAFGSRLKRERPTDAPGVYSHLVLLARNRRGYHNLVKLSSIGFLEGYYRRPRIDREVLERHHEGLIGLAACLSGEIALYLRQGNYEAAKASAQYFARVFGPDGFWLEVQSHGIADERVVAAGMFRLAAELGLPVVATNDAHYLKKEDAEAHDVLLAIGTGKDLDDPNRFRFFGQESYVKSEPEMAALFADHPEVARAGAAVRYGDPLPRAVQERLDYELGVISHTGYAGYFLIVYDIVKAAKDRGIPVGPGRGSAAGSLVAYALGITDIEPLTFDLLFERFLNPERVSMPDIDLDFCFERRGEVIQYVRERYGRESVGQIITFGTLKARAAFRDVARTLRIEPGEVDRFTKLIPAGPGVTVTLADAPDRSPELRQLARHDERVRKVLELGTRIEGLARHASVHAAGVVIAPGPLTDYVPVCLAPQEADVIITQYDMVALEQVGMLKIDVLGLKTLTVIHDARRMVEERHGITLDLDALDLEDANVYTLLGSGRTAGVFQFESPLATDCLRNMKCDRFDDLVATNALLRPGPLDSGMHLVFIRRKRGEETVRYPHDALREVLGPTYGVIVYQEQVMRIANVLGGYSLAEADVLRKAVGKKDKELLQRELGPFVERAVARGHDRRTIEDIAAQIETFGRYGFPKAHSVAYTVLSFRTAWLKTYYPAEFMAALLSSEIGNTDKVVQYINEARELGLEVLPPDVNESGFKFTVVGDRRIRFGLGAIKNVGAGAIDSIIAGRQAGGPYRSLVDLCDRIDLRLCNKRVIEALIDAGACDSLGGDHRAQLVAALDTAFGEAQARQQERVSGQHALFGEATPIPRPSSPLPDVVPWTEHERLTREKAVLGFFISGHPLARYRVEAELFGTRTTATLGQWGDQKVRIAAVVTLVKRQISKKTSAEYARLTLEDFHGTAEALVFPEAWAKLNDVIRPDEALLLTGGYSARDRGEEQAPFIVEAAQPLAELKATGAIGLTLRWSTGEPPAPEATRAAAALCASHPGAAPVLVEYGGNGATERLRSRSLKVELDDALLAALRELVGPEHVALEDARRLRP